MSKKPYAEPWQVSYEIRESVIGFVSRAYSLRDANQQAREADAIHHGRITIHEVKQRQIPVPWKTVDGL